MEAKEKQKLMIGVDCKPSWSLEGSLLRCVPVKLEASHAV